MRRWNNIAWHDSVRVSIVIVLAATALQACSPPRTAVRPTTQERLKMFDYPNIEDQTASAEDLFEDLDRRVLLHGVDGTLKIAFEKTSPEILQEVLEGKEADPNVTGLTRRNVVRLMDRMAEMEVLDDDAADALIARMVPLKDVDGLCVMLMCAPYETMEAKFADALGEVGAIEALWLLGNQLSFSETATVGGNEAVEIRAVLRRALRVAVARIIDLHLCDPCDTSDEAVMNTVNDLALWWMERYPQAVEAD